MAEPPKMQESPLFSRAYDLLRETLADSERMPRSRRAVLDRRMEEAAFTFHDALVEAKKAREPKLLLARARRVKLDVGAVRKFPSAPRATPPITERGGFARGDPRRMRR